MLCEMTIAQVQRHFVTPMSQAEVDTYQKRLDIARHIEWKDGAYYAIGDEDESPGVFDLYQCVIEEGVPYLGREDACGDIAEHKPVYFVLYAGCRIIPQA